MTAAPFADDVSCAASDAAPADDWVAEAAAAQGRYELYFDETTGQYEVRLIAGAQEEAEDFALSEVTPEPVAEPEAAAADAEVLIAAVVPTEDADAQEPPLASWASLAGPTGPSAYHTPLLWALRLTGEADFAPLPSLAHSRCGSAFPWAAAA